MDVNTVIQIINGVGFPIFACFSLGVYIVWDKKSRNAYRAEMKESQENTLIKLTESVDNNTKILNELIERLNK